MFNDNAHLHYEEKNVQSISTVRLLRLGGGFVRF